MKVLFTIGMLAEATGVNPTTLRSWERRYGIPTPARSNGGRRQYDETQVEIVKQLVQRVEQGERISVAVKHINTKLIPVSTIRAEAPSHFSYWDFLEDRIISCVEHFDEQMLNTVFSEAMSIFSAQEVSVRLLRPAMRRLGARWAERATGIAEEHFFSSFLRGKLSAISQHQLLVSPANGRILTACLPNETHDIGLMMFCLGVHAHRIRTVFLGARTPLDQIESLIADATYAFDAVVLAATVDPGYKFINEQLKPLVQNSSIPIYIGGEAAVTRQQVLTKAGLKVLGNDLDSAVDHLARDFSSGGLLQQESNRQSA